MSKEATRMFFVYVCITERLTQHWTRTWHF